MSRFAARVTLFILVTFLVVGCTEKEVNYYSNPYVVDGEALSESVEIGDLIIIRNDNQINVDTNEKQVHIDLPDSESMIQSVHVSYDQRFLAVDTWKDEVAKIFVVNLETNDVIDVSDEIGYRYDYDGYESPYGLAWAPNENILAFVGGHNEKPASPRVNMYHPEMEIEQQFKGVSHIYKAIYGVKWDEDGRSIYYLVNSLEGEALYSLYQTEIEMKSGEHLTSGTIFHVSEEQDRDDFNEWLGKK
ncbi:hypothetical protein RYX56_00100 [Alkalihalophilus lindianensis]|uniref:Uncharacterized protein n=1 Tax=Alkalihalophilus lindianensis TaxID=1630542 RepID=A0ABU3X4E9_9BACI|nr:hypothetical protein [Alkalihalophilus lindianensis]MDV2682765.1 hypothetical protein [Alkalihalophilus lindianensis]